MKYCFNSMIYKTLKAIILFFHPLPQKPLLIIYFYKNGLSNSLFQKTCPTLSEATKKMIFFMRTKFRIALSDNCMAKLHREPIHKRTKTTRFLRAFCLRGYPLPAQQRPFKTRACQIDVQDTAISLHPFCFRPASTQVPVIKITNPVLSMC